MKREDVETAIEYLPRPRPGCFQPGSGKPAILRVFYPGTDTFQCNNDLHRPVMEALALLGKYRDHKSSTFPSSETVPMDGVVADDWQALVQDDQHGGAIN